MSRDRWETRHAASGAPSAASSFVVEQLRTLAPLHRGALALDLACGAGRHSIALHEHGFLVVALDWSRAACGRLRGVLPVVADALVLPFRPASFAVVVQTCFLEREIFPRLAALLVPGGTLIVETYLVDQFERSGHPRREFCLERGELYRLCSSSQTGLIVTDSREGLVRTSTGDAFFASLAARKR